MGLDFLKISFFDILDIILVATMLYYLYKLVKGTAAINIFIGIVIIYLLGKLTQLLNMEMLSSVLGEFIGVGMIALVVVFQQEIRKFLLMLGSTNITSKHLFLKSFKFSTTTENLEYVDEIIEAVKDFSQKRTGALIVIRRNNKLDFVKDSGDEMDILVNKPILKSIFYKNSTLHDGAIIIEENKITATRVILPVSNSREIPLRFGLRHRAAIGITEKTDAIAIVVSEENGQVSYLKNGEFSIYDNYDDLQNKVKADLQ
ncbi:diadenylate cyclase CdaA [Psychroflexus halocasei]|uniref:Diadenylate cyclase n=1 Tax=Psychroflexus halocasei TaxID=908615 RepID=A0A1H3WSV0_9FLAO|nr:diadenylate cyclase CdaA [Psychroflexus halocasei]SDZ90209.1 TIGR00159 family protein [Psychroflexus halocasei]